MMKILKSSFAYQLRGIVRLRYASKQLDAFEKQKIAILQLTKRKQYVSLSTKH